MAKMVGFQGRKLSPHWAMVGFGLDSTSFWWATSFHSFSFHSFWWAASFHPLCYHTQMTHCIELWNGPFFILISIINLLLFHTTTTVIMIIDATRNVTIFNLRRLSLLGWPPCLATSRWSPAPSSASSPLTPGEDFMWKLWKWKRLDDVLWWHWSSPF